MLGQRRSSWKIKKENPGNELSILTSEKIQHVSGMEYVQGCVHVLGKTWEAFTSDSYLDSAHAGIEG